MFWVIVMAANSRADPETQYLQIYEVIQNADALQDGQSEQALGKYREAQAALKALQKSYPDWSSKLVALRLNYLAAKLGDMSPANQADVVRVSTNFTVMAKTPTVGGLFPKMPAAAKVFVVDCQRDSSAARTTTFAFQGLINQTSAEIYLISNPWHRDQLEFSGKPFEILPRLSGTNAGLRTLFQRYHAQVQKMFVYDPAKDWTWYLALMCSAQQAGIPVTDTLAADLQAEFAWEGAVADLRGKWSNRKEAYDWALSHLMPNCSRQVVFAVKRGMPLADYAVATKGFTFWLDFGAERAQVERIFRSRGYGLGTALMGYANTGDDANAVANPFGIGYVASDFYANGSFWSSFPNKLYSQAAGKAQRAVPGKIYASIMWSDGDNIQFDQNPIYLFWRSKVRGSVPVATQLSPALIELNSPLLDWYYAKLTDNDELVCGPTGLQFIFIQSYRDDLFASWCRLSKTWVAAAGLRSGRIWVAPNPSVKYATYMQGIGYEGVFGEGWRLKTGNPPKIEAYGAATEAELYERFKAIQPDSTRPVFVNFTPIVGGFNMANGGYAALERQVDRIEAEFPGRYVFMLPRDQFATIRAYYDGINLNEAGASPMTTNYLRAVDSGDGRFTVVEQNGSRCWRLHKKSSGHYLYLDVDDLFRPQPGQALEVELEFLDNESGEISMEYDSTDVRATLGGAYKLYPQKIRRSGNGQWKQARFRIFDAGFGGSQNDDADFRFYHSGEEFFVRAVRVRRVGS